MSQHWDACALIKHLSLIACAGKSSWGRASNPQEDCPGLMMRVMEPKVPQWPLRQERQDNCFPRGTPWCYSWMSCLPSYWVPNDIAGQTGAMWEKFLLKEATPGIKPNAFGLAQCVLMCNNLSIGRLVSSPFNYAGSHIQAHTHTHSQCLSTASWSHNHIQTSPHNTTTHKHNIAILSHHICQ